MKANDIGKQDPEGMFGPDRDENGERRRLHNQPIYILYCSYTTVRAIKSRMGQICSQNGRW